MKLQTFIRNFFIRRRGARASMSKNKEEKLTRVAIVNAVS